MKYADTKAPSGKTIAVYLDSPLILAPVSGDWCRIATTYPPLWSTIFIANDYLERISLFLDRSGKEPLDIILSGPKPPTVHTENFLIEHGHRFKTLIYLSDESEIRVHVPSRMEPLQTNAVFVCWGVYPQAGNKMSTLPIPKCLRQVQIHQSPFDFKFLINLRTFITSNLSL